MNEVITLTYPTLPVRLRLLREILGHSREQLASCLTKRAPGNNVGRIERGVHNPSPRTIARLAQGLGVSASFLAHGYRTDTGASPMGWKVDEGFPARLKRVLREQSVMPDELASRLAITMGALRPLVKGNIRPRPETVVNIAKALGVSASYLATGVMNTVPLKDLTPGQRLMLVRHSAQLSRSELATEAGIEDTPTRFGWQHLQMWEKGKFRPSFKQFEQVADALGVSLKFIVGDDEPSASDSLTMRERRFSAAERKILDDFRFMFESGALTAQDAAEFTYYMRKQLLRRMTAAAAA